MARRKKKAKAEESGPAWLITFTDMMTLMLTFFVLLVSMSVMDERRRLVVLGSLIGTFGIGEAGFDARSREDKGITVEPGPMDDLDTFEILKDRLWEDPTEDLRFESNKFMDIISISEDVLFEPGGTELTEKGKKLLDRFMPLFLKLDFPLLLAGHTSTLREEQADNYNVQFHREGLDPTWPLSLYRVLAVHSHLTQRAMDPTMLRVEAFGRFRPKFNEDTAMGRRRNRRVDLVMDHRNKEWITRMDRWRLDEETDANNYRYKGFEFDLSNPERDGQEGR